jgi:hypothetical protein
MSSSEGVSKANSKLRGESPEEQSKSENRFGPFLSSCVLFSSWLLISSSVLAKLGLIGTLSLGYCTEASNVFVEETIIWWVSSRRGGFTKWEPTMIYLPIYIWSENHKELELPWKKESPHTEKHPKLSLYLWGILPCNCRECWAALVAECCRMLFSFDVLGLAYLHVQNCVLMCQQLMSLIRPKLPFN